MGSRGARDHIYHISDHRRPHLGGQRDQCSSAPQPTSSGKPLAFEHSKFGNPSRDPQIGISTLPHLTELLLRITEGCQNLSKKSRLQYRVRTGRYFSVVRVGTDVVDVVPTRTGMLYFIVYNEVLLTAWQVRTVLYCTVACGYTLHRAPLAVTSGTSRSTRGYLGDKHVLPKYTLYSTCHLCQQSNPSGTLLTICWRTALSGVVSPTICAAAP